MRLHILFVTTALLASAMAPDFAKAACTQQEAMAKGVQLSQMVQTRMASDPASGQALMMKLQPIMQANQAKMMSGGAIDWNAVCSQYDAMIDQAK